MTKEDALHHSEAWDHAFFYMKGKGADASAASICIAAAAGYRQLAKKIEESQRLPPVDMDR